MCERELLDFELELKCIVGPWRESERREPVEVEDRRRAGVYRGSMEGKRTEESPKMDVGANKFT